MAIFRTLLFRLVAFYRVRSQCATPAAATTEGERRPIRRTRSSPPAITSSAKSPASLATLVEKAVSHYGLPNGYIIGQEGSGAIIGGLRYGDGVLYTKIEVASRSTGRARPSAGILAATATAP